MISSKNHTHACFEVLLYKGSIKDRNRIKRPVIQTIHICIYFFPAVIVFSVCNALRLKMESGIIKRKHLCCLNDINDGVSQRHVYRNGIHLLQRKCKNNSVNGSYYSTRNIVISEDPF